PSWRPHHHPHPTRTYLPDSRPTLPIRKPPPPQTGRISGGRLALATGAQMYRASAIVAQIGPARTGRALGSAIAGQTRPARTAHAALAGRATRDSLGSQVDLDFQVNRDFRAGPTIGVRMGVALATVDLAGHSAMAFAARTVRAIAAVA